MADRNPYSWENIKIIEFSEVILAVKILHDGTHVEYWKSFMAFGKSLDFLDTRSEAQEGIRNV